jgi:hypothetical protein
MNEKPKRESVLETGDKSKVISKDSLKRWCGVGVFAVAFAWVESAVVVYLRRIYFEDGFYFPLNILWEGDKRVIDLLVKIEFGRELATLVMLLAMGWMAGRNRLQKICFFLVAFGIWDVFYYIWLYVMIGWPPSPMTWDILFYVPLPWVGPVITPTLIAAGMFGAGSVLIYFDSKGRDVRWRLKDSVIELACGLAVIVAFCWDWKNIIQYKGDEVYTGIPNPFAWWLYLPAYILAAAYFIIRLRQGLRNNS